jgi:hypothetical protein
MDRLLRDIQAELLPEREPAPVLGEADADAPVLAEADAEAPVAVTAGAPAADPLPDAPPLATSISDPPPPPSDPQIQALTELSARLLASMRELLAGYERVLVRSSSRRPAPRPAPSRPRPGPEDPNVTVAAGPFQSLEALREFEQAVSHLPGVREVAVQGYEGTDRAIIEVRLDPLR